MPLPGSYVSEKSDASYLHSNYQSEFDSTSISEHIDRTAVGSKRLHWKKLPQPTRSDPLGYDLTINTYKNVRTILNHTELGPNGLGGTQFNYSYQQFWSTGDPYSIRDAAVQGDSVYKAKQRLFDKLKGEGTNVANMLGERKQIVKSVESLLNTIVYTVRDLKRGHLTSAIRRMGGDPLTARKLRKQDIANQWLSLQYGWKPLISDIYGLVQGLEKRESTNPYTRVHVSATQQSKKASPELGGGIAGNKSRGQVVTSCRTAYHIRVRPNDTLRSLAALGATNPAVVAWEITPWSFVVDWFLPVGNWLEQLTATNGFDFYDGCVSTLLKVTETVEGNWLNNYTAGAWNYTNLRNIHGKFDTVRFTRSTLTGFPTVEAPRFKNPISLAHIENSVALLSQLMGRGPVSARGTSPGRTFNWDSVAHS